MRLWPWTNPPKPVHVSQDYEQYNAYSQLLDRNGQWIGIADTKAGVILAFLVIILPILAAPALSILPKLFKAIPHTATLIAYLPEAGFTLLLALFLIGALVTIFQVLATLSPRLTRQGKPGLIFFGDIASQEYTQWQRGMLAIDTEVLALQVLEQVYATAYIASCKHKYVQKAIRALFITMLLGIVGSDSI